MPTPKLSNFWGVYQKAAYSSLVYAFTNHIPLTNLVNKIIIFLSNGLVAQLGAHRIRIAGVEGSNPFKSTKEQRPPKGGLCSLIDE